MVIPKSRWKVSAMVKQIKKSAFFPHSIYSTKMSWLGHFEVQLLDSTFDILANLCRELEHFCTVTEATKYGTIKCKIISGRYIF